MGETTIYAAVGPLISSPAQVRRNSVARSAPLGHMPVFPCQIPVMQQFFLMQRCPLNYHAAGAGRKAAPQDLYWVDTDRSIMLAKQNMEMGWA